jgi:hypothetical protein
MNKEKRACGAQALFCADGDTQCAVHCHFREKQNEKIHKKSKKNQKESKKGVKRLDIFFILY